MILILFFILFFILLFFQESIYRIFFAFRNKSVNTLYFCSFIWCNSCLKRIYLLIQVRGLDSHAGYGRLKHRTSLQEQVFSILILVEIGKTCFRVHLYHLFPEFRLAEQVGVEKLGIIQRVGGFEDAVRHRVQGQREKHREGNLRASILHLQLAGQCRRLECQDQESRAIENNLHWSLDVTFGEDGRGRGKATRPRISTSCSRWP